MDDIICLSGLAGRFPESENVEEFWQNLLSGKDLVTEDSRRWKPGLWGLPKRNGKLKQLDKFDASFFEVHPKQANNMDPQLRLLLEVSFEAIVDAGISPSKLAGSRTGVWVGVSGSESREVLSSDPETLEGYGMTGCTTSMFANRLSYFYDLKGPSMSVDTACSSSLLALQMACQSIREGHCDAAIVGGSNLLLKPQCSLQFQRLNMLSPDGACKSFDASGNGYARSEAVAAIFICKKGMTSQSYCDVVHAKTNTDGRKKEGITFPSGYQQSLLLRETYAECGLNPQLLDYVEAHGTGTKAGDPQELGAIDEVMCANRESPLLIGSVKSNMGHSEPASGLCAVVKCALAVKSGTLPPNLHFEEPNPDIPGLTEGRLKVVTEATSLPANALVGINSFGFGGSNVHVILRSSEHENRDVMRPVMTGDTPRLQLFTARTEKGLEEKLQNANNLTSSGLWDIPPLLHPHRGYVVTMKDSDVRVSEQYKAGAGSDVWFICSGMGCQWKGMGVDLLRIPIFSKAIDRCNDALRCYDVNVRQMLLTADDVTYEDSINAFVGLAAVQVGLIDVLSSVGVKPSGIIGHSVGELACSYADGCLTLEQTLKAAYLRGKCIKEASLPNGAMAAVGLSWEECLNQCPPGVAPACHNSSDSVTISGEALEVQKFVMSLKERGVFAKLVNTGGIAFHSKFMAQVYPTFIEQLKKIIPDPKTRSLKWISTSADKKIPRDTDEWKRCVANCSAEYHANNLCKPVMFHDAIKSVPDGAVVLEIAPHCLMQAILKRSLPPSCERVRLADRKEPDGAVTLYRALGKLHGCGVDLDLHALQGQALTRDLLPACVDWDHSASWYVPSVDEFLKSAGGGGEMLSDLVKIDKKDPKQSYLWGHVIDGRALLPATAHLVFAWQTLAKRLQVALEDAPVQFDDVAIHRATVLPESGKLELLVQLVPSTREFRISEAGKLACSGKVALMSGGDIDRCEDLVENGAKLLQRNEVYRKLRLAGYQYKGEFQAICEANQSGLRASVTFAGNYVTFLDAQLQISIIGAADPSLRLPTRIRQVKLKPFPSNTKEVVVPAVVDKISDCTFSSGHVLVTGLHVTSAPRRDQTRPLLQTQVFVPNTQSGLSEHDSALQRYKQATLAYLASNIDVFEKKLKLGGFQLNRNGTKETPLDYDKYLSANPDSYLLRLLKDLVENQQELSDLVRSRVSLLGGDWLLNYCTSKEDVLTSVVDVVLENVGDVISIAELPNVVLETNQDLSKAIRCHLDNAPNVELRHAFLGDVTSSEDEDDVIVAWDPASGTSPPPSLKGVNLFLLNQPFSKGKDRGSNLLQGIAPHLGSAFLLFHQQTKRTLFHQITDALLAGVDPQHKCEYPDSEQVESELSTAGFEIVLRKSDDSLGSNLFLCRLKVNMSVKKTEIIDVGLSDFGWVETLQNLVGSSQSPVWLKGDKNANGVVGMVNCLRKEPNGKKVRCIINGSLDPSEKSPSKLSDVIARDLAVNVYRDGQWGTFRHVKASAPNKVSTTRGYVSALTQGDLASLQWIAAADDGSRKITEKQRVYRVAFAALNFRDVMLASGKLPSDAIPGNWRRFSTLLGLEFSGYDVSGSRIMGMVPAEGLATHVTTEPRFTWEIPENWTMSEAATVPVTYSTAYYALLVRGRLRRGDTVLVHSGAGGVGQAAIGIALSRGCRVFTTVSSRRKREHLMARFPQLSEASFANSRDLSFERHVMKQTDGRGVDIVLNSLAEEKLEASVRCVAKHGRFLEIGKFDLAQNSKLGMSVFLRNISFHGILLDSLFDDDTNDWRETADHVTEGIRTGVVRPLDTTIYKKNEIESAFRFMAQGKHIGKVLIDVESGNDSLDAMRKTSFDPEMTYVITGGLGGFGLELCDWMIHRGARRVVITSRSGVKTAYQQQYLTKWRARGADVTVSKCDVSTPEGASELLSDDVGGIFHLAMVLKDSLFQNQNAQSFEDVCGIKCNGTDNLDRESRLQCKRLRLFVVFSSVVSGRGNPGQTNYGLANSHLERVCEQRARDGLPALAVQWGAVGDVGVAVETIGSDVIGGTLLQSMASCLNTLDRFLSQQVDVVVSSIVPAPKSRGKRKQEGGSSIIDAVANIIGIQDTSKINKEVTFSSLGLDSLMAIEITQKLERDFNVTISSDDVQQLTFAKLELLSDGSQPSAPTSSDPADDVNRRAMEDYLLLEEKVPTLMPLNDIPPSEEESLIFVHPIGGSSTVFREIASQLNVQALGLNCSPEAPLESVGKLAEFYLGFLPARKRCILVGYSFGACIALEMAVRMQALNRCDVTLMLIDGSPHFVTARTGAYKNAVTNTSKRDAAVLTSFVHDVIPTVDQKDSRLVFMRATSWKERVDDLTKILRRKFPDIDRNLVEQSVDGYYRRIHIGDSYVIEGTFQDDVTLIKQSQVPLSGYRLNDVISGKVHVIELDADHAGIICGTHALRIADEIKSIVTS